MPATLAQKVAEMVSSMDDDKLDEFLFMLGKALQERSSKCRTFGRAINLEHFGFRLQAHFGKWP